jgi:hypothetical protein
MTKTNEEALFRIISCSNNCTAPRYLPNVAQKAKKAPASARAIEKDKDILKGEIRIL